MTEEQIKDLQIIKYNLIDFKLYLTNPKEIEFVEKQIQGINYILGEKE